MSNVELDNEQSSSALINVEKLNPLEVFTEKGVDPILQEITKKVKEFVPDVSTAKGRREIASMANKVARSKTLLDDLGKNLVSEWKQKAAVVDASRKKIRDDLDALKAEAREPLTKWEMAEESRVFDLKQKVASIQSLANLDMTLSAEAIQKKIDGLNAMTIDENYQEFQVIAQSAKENSLSLLTVQLSNKIESDRQRAELDRLRRQEQENMAKAHEQHLRELEEKAKADRAQAELERVEAEKKAAVEAMKQAEERARLAEENAKREAELAVKREQDRIAAEKARLEQEKKAAEMLAKKKLEIITKATEDLAISTGVSHEVCLIVVRSIADNKIPNLKMVSM